MFIRNTNKNSEICVMRSDGTDLKVITSSNKDKHGINAVNYWGGRWSPDKTKIILRSFPNEISDYYPMYLIDLDNPLKRTRLDEEGHEFVWSPSSTHIYYITNQPWMNSTEIKKLDIFTDEKDVLWIEGYEGFNPLINYWYHLFDISSINVSSFLMHQQRITYDTMGKLNIGEQDLILFNVLAEEKKYLANFNFNDQSVRLSPDGNYIAYMIPSDDVEGGQIHLMTVEGDSLKRLTSGENSYWYGHLAWSPDGTQITYSKIKQNTGGISPKEIYVLDLVTGIETRLTENDTYNNIVIDWR
ncbi:MAG: hypothetical protein HOA15_09580 [Candidatus Marinimicrobia bacterium]|jgi:Tol biopolymer transport system component|nr:hypothetical protein [Candidatus Neomarinimicrobiota bacterium]MBT3676697.1 hypothetical protein [Candidatus Neomarinimicrobiota bacterium]MBT3764071.1 hypothetical protein [Candidatus Neomarinimicrobiota bacterium]MBT4069416.1 hypothetical protein [Candidatus Neomarinimicrobiota bacterium]MBT4271468.1 hypothetical protein [Candidatus Neomarinimicrobiota bacterium]